MAYAVVFQQGVLTESRLYLWLKGDGQPYLFDERGEAEAVFKSQCQESKFGGPQPFPFWVVDLDVKGAHTIHPDATGVVRLSLT